MSDVPAEIYNYEILLRVPAVHLFRFRSVCKAWRSIIDEYGLDQLLIRNDTGKLYLLPISSIDCSKNHNITVEMTNIKNLVRRGVPRILSLPVPSYSGLILIQPSCRKREWTVWNPLTGESIPLPTHNHLTGGGLLGCGVGYDYATDDFKVVKIVPVPRGLIFTVQTIMYSLKLNYWKNISNVRKPVYGSGVFVNGALHWKTSGVSRPACIVSLDLSTEENHVLPRPSFLLDEQNLKDFVLDVLGGCLCLRNDRAIWILKDYGKNVWTELVSFEQLPELIMRRPIAYIKRKGQVLFQLKTAELLLFDVEKKCAKKVRIGGVCQERFTCQVFTSSLFRLNRGAGGDGSVAVRETLKRKRKTGDNRLEVELKISDVYDPPFSPSFDTDSDYDY